MQEKAQRSIIKNINTLSADISDRREPVLSLPTVYWAGIDSPGGYCPTLNEWGMEVAKRYFRKIAVMRFSMTHNMATRLYYKGI